MAEPERRRRRHRSTSAPVPEPPVPAPPVREPPPVPEGAGGERTGTETVIETTAVADPEEPPGPRTGRRPGRPPSGAGPGGDDVERGLRGLVGSGSSQVSVGAALRARDAARAGAEQLADAEQNLTIVRRNWTPRDELPRRPPA